MKRCSIAYMAVIPKGSCQHMLISLSICQTDNAYHTALIWQSIRNREEWTSVSLVALSVVERELTRRVRDLEYLSPLEARYKSSAPHFSWEYKLSLRNFHCWHFKRFISCYCNMVGKQRHSFSKDNCFEQEPGTSGDLWLLS